MTETIPLFSITYALQLLYWLTVYGLAGYAVKHMVETAYLHRHAHAHSSSPRRSDAKPKRRR